jgi:hypothetical protein
LNDRPVPTTRAALEDLKARHIAFLGARLSSPRARSEWRANIASALDELVRLPLTRVVDPPALDAALDTALSRSTFDEALRPALERLARDAHAQLVRGGAPIGEFVPAAAQNELLSLFARPDLIPAKLIREVAEHEAAREVMREVMHDALKQFSERTNPFVADWGLPALLKKLGPFGGSVGKGIEGVRHEFEKRLDPEIRKFLQVFAQKSLEDVATSVITRADTPPFIALRRRLATFFLEQRLGEVLLEQEGSAQATRIALDVTSHLLAHEGLADRRRVFTRSVLEAHGKTPIADVLAALGLPAKPPAALIDALADATFPTFAAVLETESAKRWLGSLVAEFYDGLVAEDEVTRDA